MVGGAGSLSPPKVFHTLDALRGIAAIAVLFGHFASYFGSTPFGSWLVIDGTLAVDLFFVMSGIVVEHAYGRRLADGMTFGTFFCIRLVRLYPLYLLGLILGTYAFLQTSGSARFLLNVPTWTVGLLMLPRPGPNGIALLFPLIVVAWSLFVELVVNFLYALTYRLWSIRSLCLVITIAGIGLVVSNAEFGDLDNGFNWASLHIALLRSLYGFLLGVLFRRTYRPDLSAGSSAPAIATVIASICVFHATTYLHGVVTPLVLVAFEALQLIVVPALALAGLYTAPSKSLWSTFAFLGAISYPLYCVHPNLILMVFRTENVWAQSLWIVAIFIFAVIADRFYDRPIRSWLTRKLDLGSRPAQRPAA